MTSTPSRTRGACANWPPAPAWPPRAGSCGPGRVAELLPELFRALTTWHAMLRHHPDALLEEAERQLTTLPEASRGLWWERYAPGMALAAGRRPARVLDLLER